MKTPTPYLQALASPKPVLFSILLVIASLISVNTNAQSVRDQTKRDTLCYIYKLNNSQLEYIYKKAKLKDTTWLLTQKVDSFRHDQFDQRKLADGCYIQD